MSSNLPVLERRRMIPQREWVQQPNEIRYTTTNGQKIANSSAYAPNNPLLKNIYHPVYGGVLIFRNPVTSIGVGFRQNTTLSSVTFIDEQNITSFPDYAFQLCSNLRTIRIPESCTTLGVRCIDRCSPFNLSALSENITTLKEGAFHQTSVSFTKLPSKLTKIDNIVFRGCSNLRLTELPSGVTSIGGQAFESCSNITLTGLPDSVTSIGQSAFASCTKLALSSLPSGITRIENSTFKNCSNITLSSLPSGITYIGEYAFQKCPKITLSSLPSGVTVIYQYTFNDCAGLTNFTLHEGITSIANQAFIGSYNLRITEFPSTLRSIGAAAFYACNSLSDIKILNTTQKVTNGGTNTFSNSYHKVTIRVPNSLLAEYQADSNWANDNVTLVGYDPV